MKYSLEVCLIAVALSSSTAWSQTLQKGFSVDLPTTANAASAPEADSPDALIVTIAANGDLYFGANRLHDRDLTKQIQSRVGGQTGTTLYIKADSRCPYQKFIKVLDAVQNARVRAIFLLTTQHDANASGMVPPQGFKLSLGR